MNFKLYIYTFLILFFTCLLGWYWWNMNAHLETTDNAYVRGSITTISSRISGHIEEVPGIVNTTVKTGDNLVKFDQGPFLAVYESAKANLLEAEAQMLEVEAKINAISVKVNEAKTRKNLAAAKKLSAIASSKSKVSNMELLKLENERAERLYKTKTATKSRLDSAKASFSSAMHEVNQAEAEISAAEYSEKAIEAEIKEIKTNLDKLEAEKLNLN